MREFKRLRGFAARYDLEYRVLVVIAIAYLLYAHTFQCV
jgi:hypothetical protein